MPSELLHETEGQVRSRVVAFVAKHPGVRLMQIVDFLGERTIRTQNLLEYLLDIGRLESETMPAEFQKPIVRRFYASANPPKVYKPKKR